MTDQPETLGALLAVAASVGVVHTLAGPDHYLPIAAWAKGRELSRRAALSFTALAGLIHCATSVVLVLLAWWLVDGAAALAGLQALRADVLAWALIGTGLALAVVAVRRRREPANVRDGLRPWLLVLLALGPCEWLVPNAMAAGAASGFAGALLVTGVFTLATVLTMVACVGLALRVPLPRRSTLPARLVPGVTMLACGALVLAGF